MGCKSLEKKSETLETGWAWCHWRGRGVCREGCCTPRKCTDEVIADVSLQNPKASKISKISLCLWEVEKLDMGETKQTFLVNIENPGFYWTILN